MEVLRNLPSNAPKHLDKETGKKFSDRDLSIISSKVNISSSLIKFEENKYTKWKNKGFSFLVYDTGNGELGYLVYKENENFVDVKEVFSNSTNLKKRHIAYEALIETVFNLCKATDKKLKYNCEDEEIIQYFRTINQRYKEQKIEETYWWTIK